MAKSKRILDDRRDRCRGSLDIDSVMHVKAKRSNSEYKLNSLGRPPSLHYNTICRKTQAKE